MEGHRDDLAELTDQIFELRKPDVINCTCVVRGDFCLKFVAVSYVSYGDDVPQRVYGQGWSKVASGFLSGGWHQTDSRPFC